MLWLGAGCSGTNTEETASAPTDASPDTGVTTQGPACLGPVVRLQTGPDETCDGGNEHVWPVGLAPERCHGWTAQDPTGEVHDNSAAAIGCNPDGSFSFTQYAGNLDCEGTGVTKTFVADECTQDIPPVLYTVAIDLACCTDPESGSCTEDIPSVSVPGGQTFIDGVPCAR